MSEYDAEGTLYIPIEEWYEFIQKKFPFLSGGQFVLGAPRMTTEDVEIPYAKGTDEVHPNEWGVKPAWMK